MTFKIAFYKGVHPGLPGIYNRLVQWWTKSPYSHCELVFSDGLSASSSFMDGGVRFKQINYSTDTHWDFITLPNELEHAARKWFEDRVGAKYDLKGNLGFVIGAVHDSKDKFFCSEACAAALQLGQASLYSPATLYPLLAYIFKKENSNGG